MDEQDKAHSTIPESPNQQLLAKVDHRDKLIRAIEVVVLLALVIFNVFSAVRLQQVIDQNNSETVEARASNVKRQTEIKDYIKCVLLIRYDNPPEALTTKEGTSKALDTCASNTKP